jgi:hypothetical protein
MASGDLVQQTRHCRRCRQQSPTHMDGQTRTVPDRVGRANRAVPDRWPGKRVHSPTVMAGRDPPISSGTVLDATPGPMLCVPRFNATQYCVSN